MTTETFFLIKYSIKDKYDFVDGVWKLRPTVNLEHRPTRAKTVEEAIADFKCFVAMFYRRDSQVKRSYLPYAPSTITLDKVLEVTRIIEEQQTEVAAEPLEIKISKGFEVGDSVNAHNGYFGKIKRIEKDAKKPYVVEIDGEEYRYDELGIDYDTSINEKI